LIQKNSVDLDWNQHTQKDNDQDIQLC
jgi:hypothetical protein